MTCSEQEKQVTVRGIVVPLAWTEDGTVTAVGVSSFDEREFALRSAMSLGRWIMLLRKEVEVIGVVSGSAHGLEAIRVCDYRVVEKGVRNEIG